jgi:hypothetical protein
MSRLLKSQDVAAVTVHQMLVLVRVWQPVYQTQALCWPNYHLMVRSQSWMLVSMQVPVSQNLEPVRVVLCHRCWHR